MTKCLRESWATCFEHMTDDERLDAYGFDRAGRVRTVGKGREIHGRDGARDVSETINKLFPETR